MGDIFSLDLCESSFAWLTVHNNPCLCYSRLWCSTSVHPLFLLSKYLFDWPPHNQKTWTGGGSCSCCDHIRVLPPCLHQMEPILGTICCNMSAWSILKSELLTHIDYLNISSPLYLNVWLKISIHHCNSVHPLWYHLQSHSNTLPEGHFHQLPDPLHG